MTNQISERLTYKGETLALTSYPGIPKDHPRVALDRSPVAEADLAEKLIRGSTACWRGYQGSWKIENMHLYLVGLRGQYTLDGPEPLLANWFTGDLRIPQGRRIDESYGWPPLYERDLVITIEDGKVLSSRTEDNSARWIARQEFLKDLRSGKLFSPLWRLRKALNRLFHRR